MGSKIKALRGLIFAKFDTEADMARAMGWKRQKLNKITNGIHIPNLFELQDISDALDVPYKDIANIFLDKLSPNG